MQTSINEALTPDLLRTLAAAKPPCVTVALPGGGNAHARWGVAMRQIEAELAARGPGSANEGVLARLHEAIQQIGEENRAAVVLTSPDVHHVFLADAPVREVVESGDAFNLRPILALLEQKKEFYLLALNQNRPRLLHCTESTSGEVALPPDAPKNFLDFRETRQPDHRLETRSASGPGTGSMKGVMSGSSSDADDKNAYHHDYYRAIDRAVSHLLNGGQPNRTKPPLVVVAVEHELAIYGAVNTYPEMVAPGVHGAPDGLKGGEMHKRALELLASYRPQAIRQELEHFEKHAGTGHASSHAQEIVKAAFEGRVAHLFIQETAEYRGVFDDVRHRVKHHEDAITPARDLLNDAIAQTLIHGGEVTLLRPEEMPNGVPVCAVLRYPSAELLAAMKENAEQTV